MLFSGLSVYISKLPLRISCDLTFLLPLNILDHYSNVNVRLNFFFKTHHYKKFKMQFPNEDSIYFSKMAKAKKKKAIAQDIFAPAIN